MGQIDSHSSDEPESILVEYYQKLPKKLKEFISYVTSIEIGFSISESVLTAIMYNEAFKGFLVSFREQNHEIRLTFVRTFIAPSKYSPAIATMEVFFENGMPKGRWFVSLILPRTQETSLKELQDLLKNANYENFLLRVTKIGRKLIGQTLSPIDKNEKEHFMSIFNFISKNFSDAIKQFEFPIDSLIMFVEDEKNKFPEVSDLFISYLQGIKKR